jgi:hypothetical protein
MAVAVLKKKTAKLHMQLILALEKILDPGQNYRPEYLLLTNFRLENLRKKN